MLIDQMEPSADQMDLSLEQRGQAAEIMMRRSPSFKLNIWTNMAVQQEQTVTLLQSTVQKLTADNAEQQILASQVRLHITAFLKQKF